MRRMQTYTAVLFLAALLRGAAAQAAPDNGAIERLRVLEQGQREKLERLRYLKQPKRGHAAVNYGAWSSTTYFNFANNDNSRGTPDAFHGLLLTDYRAWANVVTRSDIAFYVRLRDQNHNFYRRTGIPDIDTSKADSFDLDLGCQ